MSWILSLRYSTSEVFIPFCSGCDVSRLSRRKADLVLSFSFSDCMPRISTEKPSWDRNAWSPASCSRTRPKVATGYIYLEVDFVLNISLCGHRRLFNLCQGSHEILTRDSVKSFHSDGGVGVWVCQLQQLWQRPHAEQVDLHLRHVLSTGSDQLGSTPP